MTMHRFLRVAVVSAGLLLAPLSALAESAPPRTIDDILKILEHHKPDPQAAQRAREAADRQPPNTTDSIDLAKFYSERARAAQQIGRVKQQLEDLRIAYKHGQGLSPGERSSISSALSQAESTGGNFATALELRKQQVDVSAAQGSSQLTIASAVVTNFYAQMGDLPSARAALARAEAAMDDASRNPKQSGLLRQFWISRIEAARASLARAEGKVIESEGAWRKAIAATDADIRARPNQGGIENSHNALSSYMRALSGTLSALDRHAEAELVMRQALKVALERGGRDSANVGVVVSALGGTLFQQGRGREGIILTKEAIGIMDRAGSAPEAEPMVRAHQALGRAYARQQRWQDANTEFEQMYAGLQKNDLLQHKVGVGDLSWGLTLVRVGDSAKAIAILKPMLEQEGSRFGADSFQAAEVRGFLGIAHAAAGDRATALTEFKESVPILVDRVHDQAGRAGGGGRTWRLTQIYESYIGLLLDMLQRGEQSAGVDALAESFRIADIARGGRVQGALNASAARASISDPQLAELARKEQDAEQRLSALSELLTNMLSAPPAQQVASVLEGLRKEMQTLRAERTRTVAEIEKRFPDYANLIRPKPPTLDQVRANLRESEALVSIYVTADRSFVWAVPKTGSPAVATAPIGDAEITKRVNAVRKALDPNATTIDDIPKFEVAAAHGLYSALLKPVESAWGQAKSVLIVPHAALGQLPFALLPTTDAVPAEKEAVPFESYRKVEWLARRVAITQLPSVNTLVSLRRAPVGTDTRRAYAGFGDPFFSTMQAKETIAALSDEGLGTRGVRLRNKPKTDKFDTAQLALLPRLPDTRAEILDVAQAMRADISQDVFLGERATVQAVKGASLANRKVIHFATHGLVPGELDGLTQPALAMTTPDLPGTGGGDGLLKLEDILALKLNADWVVLSACNTASADGGSAEAVSGLGRAFFFAGARALLVSNWPVDSASARKLMTDVFRRQAADAKMDRAEALRLAMLQLIDSGAHQDAKDQPLYSYAHPLFWAPFSLVGDGGAR